MPERAQVRSIEAIDAFRASLIVFLSKARVDVEEEPALRVPHPFPDRLAGCVRLARPYFGLGLLSQHARHLYQRALKGNDKNRDQSSPSHDKTY